MKKNEDEVLEIIKKTVAQAETMLKMSNGQAWMQQEHLSIFCVNACEVAIKNGATTINIPDTVGYAIPREFNNLIKTLREKVPGADEVIFSTPVGPWPSWPIL